MDVTFANPEYLWFLIGIPILLLIHVESLNKLRRNALKFANFEAIYKIVGGRQVLSKNTGLLFLRCFALLFITLAMSGVSIWYQGYVSNTDFVLAIDTSNSMIIEDFKPDRISAAKSAAMKFVDISPPNSRIGVVTFSGSPVVIQELSDNRISIKKSIDDIYVGVSGGTNIGDAIITSVNSLLLSNNSKSVILITDGQSNIGPTIEESIEYSNNHGITVHTIGIGSEEGGAYSGTSVVLRLNEPDLINIAMETEGNYYRVGDEETLNFAYEEIAQLEKQKIRRDMTAIFGLGVFAILLIEWFLMNTRYRTIP